MGWTDKSVEELRRMWEQGLTANEIAKKLGVTKNSIVGKVHRLCLKARPSPIKSKDRPEAPMPLLEPVLETAIELPVDTEVVADIKENKKTTKTHGTVRLVDLDAHTCRWPIGDPRDDDFCFCGKKVKSGQTYCDEHSALAYVKATRK